MKLQFFDIKYAILQTRSRKEHEKEKEKVEKKKVKLQLLCPFCKCQKGKLD